MATVKIPSFEISNPEPTCCDSPSPFSSNREVVCLNCGMVLDQLVVEDQARLYDRDDKYIKSNEEVSPTGHFLIFRGIGVKYHHLARINQYKDSFTREILVLWEYHKIISNLLHPPSFIKQNAWKISRVYYKNNGLAGYSCILLSLASYYISFKIHRLYQSASKFLEILQLFYDKGQKFNQRLLWVLIQKVQNTLGVSYQRELPKDNVKTIIHKMACELNLGESVVTRSIKTLDCCKIFSKDPRGYAAAAIYLSCHKSFSQQRICNTIGITETTMRARVKDFSIQGTIQAYDPLTFKRQQSLIKARAALAAKIALSHKGI